LNFFIQIFIVTCVLNRFVKRVKRICYFVVTVTSV